MGDPEDSGESSPPSSSGADTRHSETVAARPSPPGTETPSSSESPLPDGLDALELEVLELLNAPPPTLHELASAPIPGTVALPPPVPTSVGGTGEEERVLREEILQLRSTLETIRRDMAAHRDAVAGVHGQLVQVHSALHELRRPPEEAGAEPSTPAPEPEEPRPRPLSAAPVFFLGPRGEEVEAQAFFTLGRGGALETFLTRTLHQWESSGYALETRGGVEGFSLQLVGDPEGRGLKLLPSGMYLVRLGEREVQALRKLPPLVSSKVLPASGGFMSS